MQNTNHTEKSPKFLIENKEKISNQLAQKLYDFAKATAITSCLDNIISWKTVIACQNHENNQQEKYIVKFINEQGKKISLIDIELKNNTPTSHSGFAIQV